MTLSTSRNLTVLGIITIVQAIAQAAVAYFDGDASTMVDLNVLFTQLAAGIGLIMAKGAQTTGGTVDAVGKPV